MIILFNCGIRTVHISSMLPQRLMEMLNIKPKAPPWVKTYFSWHAEQREDFLDDNSTKFLILICHRDHHCGGVADRFKSLPHLLRFAEQTKRMLFIKWEKFDLEDFLQPPLDGLDWRLPEFVNVSKTVDYDGSLIELRNDKDNELHKQKNIFLSTHLAHQYELEFTFTLMQAEALHRVILQSFFEPVPALEKQIKKTMDNLGLIPKQYVAAHYRSEDQYFFNETLSVTMLDEKTEYEIHNAIQCAVEKGNNMTMPVYFTSSSSQNVKYVLKESPFAPNRNPPVKVVGIESTRIHSEFPTENYYGQQLSTRIHSESSTENYYDQQQHNASELYPIFVDLWIMARSKCVAFGKLGFGRLGSRLTGDYCNVNYQRFSCPILF